MPKIKCGRCTMSFQVTEAPWDGAMLARTAWKGEITRCAEPGCKRPFWHGACRRTTEAGSDTNHIRVGVDPAWLHEWGLP